MLTRFELARAHGVRVLQLSLGAPPLVKGINGFTATMIARKEMEKGALPMIIVREYPDGHEEKYNLKGELIGKTEKQ